MAVIYAKNKTTGEWERVSPETAVIDPTLSIEGSPADAKATGDALEEIRNQIDNISDNISFDGLATEEYVNSKFDEVNEQITTKQDSLTFDATPTEGSTNPVTSEGIKTYVDDNKFVLPDGYPTQENIVIEWDGDTTGLTNIQDALVKVADISFDIMSIQHCKIEYLDNNGAVKSIEFTEEYISQMEETGFMTSDYAGFEAVILVGKDGTTISDIYFEEAGVYFYKYSDTSYVTYFEIKVLSTMSPTLLPSDIAYKPYVDEQINSITPESIGAMPADATIPSIDGLATETYVDEQLATKQNTLTVTDDGAGNVVIS